MTSQLSNFQEISSNYIMEYNSAEAILGEGDSLFHLALEYQDDIVGPSYIKEILRLLDGGADKNLEEGVLRQIDSSLEKIKKLLEKNKSLL